MLNIGCHLSTSKGFKSMGDTALSIGANTFQFFTRNPRGGKAKDIDKKDIEELLKYLAKINKPEDITNTDIWTIIFEVKKLTNIAIKAPTPSQKTKKPTVIISQIKNIPEAINHICHIKTSILA